MSYRGSDNTEGLKLPTKVLILDPDGIHDGHTIAEIVRETIRDPQGLRHTPIFLPFLWQLAPGGDPAFHDLTLLGALGECRADILCLCTYYVRRDANTLTIHVGKQTISADAFGAGLLAAATKLLILYNADNRDEGSSANDFARLLVDRGCIPAALIIDEAPLRASLHAMLKNLTHNTGLINSVQDALTFADWPESALLYVNQHEDELFKYDKWAKAFANDFEGKRAALMKRYDDLSHLTTECRRFLYGPDARTYSYPLDTMQPKISGLKWHANNIQQVLYTPVWPLELNGVVPLANAVDTYQEVDRLAEEMPLLYGDDEPFQALYSKFQHEAARAPRVINAAFRTADRKRVLRAQDPLVADEKYDLLVDIGPRWDKLQSLVRDNAEFPVDALPPRQDVYVLDVLFLCEAASEPVSRAQLYLPAQTGRSSAYQNGRPGAPGPVGLSVSVPRSAVAGPSRTIAGRLSIYFEGNLLQSGVVTFLVVRSSTLRTGVQARVDIDFVLAPGFQDLASFRERLLLQTVDSKPAARRVALNLTLNDDGADGLRIILVGKDIPDGVFSYSELVGKKLLNSGRSALLDSFWMRKAGIADHSRPALDSSNAKSACQFEEDLRVLAPLGRKLLKSMLSATQPVRSPLTADQWADLVVSKITAGDVVQINRTARSEYILPWALFYDIRLPGSPTSYGLCPSLATWPSGIPTEIPKILVCPHEHDPEHQENVLCPYAFWGLKYFVEQPLNRESGSAKEPCQPSQSRSISIARTTDPTLATGLDRHLSRIQSWPEIVLDPSHPVVTWTDVRSMLESPQVVYFVCHGGSDNGEPYLSIGAPGGSDSKITLLEVSDLREPHSTTFPWREPFPMVFINGCNTTDLQPGDFLNFVQEFAKLGAGAVVGSEIPLEVAVAAEMGERILREMFDGAKVGEAVYRARWEFARKCNLLGLAYTAYGLSNYAAATVRVHAPERVT